MSKHLVIAILCSSLAACGGGYAGGAGTDPGTCSGGGTPMPPSSDATISLRVTNYDAVDYALWVQWQDNLGNVNQDFVTILPAAPPGSQSQVLQDVPVTSGMPYSLLLLDSSGTPWDSIPLGILNPGDVVPLNASVLNGSFLVS